MHNVVLSPIDLDVLVKSISDQVTANILNNAGLDQNNISEPAERLLTIQEASTFLRLSVPTIYSKVSKGELPVMKRGKRLYFSNEELMAYLKTGRKKTSEEVVSEVEAFLTTQKK